MHQALVNAVYLTSNVLIYRVYAVPIAKTDDHTQRYLIEMHMSIQKICRAPAHSSKLP